MSTEAIIQSMRCLTPLDGRGTFGLAVSGGVDSVVLLRAAVEAKRCGILAGEGVVLHFDHRLRQTSNDDAVFVASLASRFGFEFAVGHADVDALRAGDSNLEARARRLRYDWFSKISGERSIGVIATAHHADDVVETVALQLLRGSGLAAWRGIPRARWLDEERRTVMMRPFLDIDRDALESALVAWELEHREDESNRDTRHLRNRVRHEVLPQLGADGRKVAERISWLAVRASTLHRQLHSIMPGIIERAVLDRSAHAIVVDRDFIASLPADAGIEVLHRIAREIGVDDPRISRSAFLRLSSKSASRSTAEAAAGLRLQVLDDSSGRSAMRIERLLPSMEVPEAVALDVPGSIKWSDIGRLSVRRAIPGGPRTDPSRTQLVERTKIVGRLTVRVPKRGDRFQPFGFEGHRLVFDALRDAGIDADLRRRWPLICDDAGVLWIAGVRCDERCRVASDIADTIEFKLESPYL